MSDILWLPGSEGVAQANDSYTVQRGFSNPLTGAGGAADLVNNTNLHTVKYLDRSLLETLYVESWSAGKVIDLIVDDIFAPGVVWGDDGEDRKKMVEHLNQMNFWRNLSDAARAGRLYGTALLIACPSSRSMFDKPLDLDNISEGDIANLVVADRHSLTVKEVYDDPSQPFFGQPYSYEWTYRSAGSGMGVSSVPTTPTRLVHESRCFKFDGVSALNREGWMDVGGERWWGFSVLQRVLDELIQDMLMSAAGSDVVQRTGMPVIMIDRFREALSKGVAGGGPSPQTYANTLANNINRNKVLFLDAHDKIDQIQINSSGVRDLLDSQVERLAMIAGVPITRFTGASAMGLNATGNGDAREWRTTVEAYRQKHIEPHITKLMLLMARNAGLSETPPWQWGRLGEMTVQEQVDALKGAAEGVTKMYVAGFIDEGEARDMLVNLLPGVNLDPEDFEPHELGPGGVDKSEMMEYNAKPNEDTR